LKKKSPPDKNKTADSNRSRAVADFSSTTTAFRFRPGKHQYDFTTRLSLPRRTKFRFRYKLEGLDEGWIEADGKRFAALRPLRPGKFVSRSSRATTTHLERGGFSIT